MKKHIAAPQPPPAYQQGYAVFVKLWDLSAEVSADMACSLFESLDRILLSVVEGVEEKWFPSPYGGAVVVADIETALLAARTVIQKTGAAGITASVGIAFGGFERVLNVTRWNTSALTMNLAGRMASNPELKGCVVVHAKVRNDAIQAKKEFDQLFSGEKRAQVKRTSFNYHLLTDADYKQRIIAGGPKLKRSRARTRSTDIVLFDIERYSEKPQDEQTRLVNSLSRCVELTLDIGIEPAHFGPAGDGGYMAFVAGTTAQIAWSFARQLRSHARREGIPLRIGIANGPTLSTSTRAVVGGAVLLADAVSSESESGEIAVTKEFWDRIPSPLKNSWGIASTTANGFLVLKEVHLEHASRGNLLHATVSTGDIPEASKFEIEMYWGYRPAAHEDLRQAILSCTSKLFIAGQGVTTIANVLNDPQVVAVLADHITKFPDFERTIVSFTRMDDPRIKEEGGRELRDKIKMGRNALRRFYNALNEKVPTNIVRPLIDFRCYDETTIPRHFILQADEVIYVGSYLSHQQGAYSYLIKIRNRADGLYALFSDEITYIKKHTIPQQLDDDKSQPQGGHKEQRQ